MCLTCSIIQGDIIPVGGIIYQDDCVVLHHCIDINIPGYLILSPIKHTETYSQLNERDLLEMAIIMKFAVAALEALDGVDKVYIANFGEETTHFHMHIFPRYHGMLTHLARDIRTDQKVDGAKLLSYCRKRYKTTSECMETNEILAVIQQVKVWILKKIDEKGNGK